MRITTITCDLCTSEIIQKSWEDAPRSATIWTETAGTNPMRKHGDHKGQLNKTHFEELCYKCQRELANRISEIITDMKNKGRGPDA